jgi:hypothetical protein
MASADSSAPTQMASMAPEVNPGSTGLRILDEVWETMDADAGD